MAIKAKICGLGSPEMVAGAVAAGADAVGFVFVPESPRYVAPENVAALAAKAGGTLRVGVFVDPEDALLEAAVRAAGLGAIQLQGQESPARVAAIRARFGVAVWRALSVSTREDIEEAVACYPMADALLFDARPPEGAKLTGGNGMAFDWGLLQGVAIPRPWILAGGLTPRNVAAAIAATGAGFVDVSSGVEAAPGKKSLEKITAFLKAAHSAAVPGKHSPAPEPAQEAEY